MSSMSTRDYLRELGAVAALAAVLALLFAIPAARAVAEAEPVAGSIGVVVDGLVGEALRANLELEAAGTTVAERLAALDAARARYLPVLDFNARYSAADGGRV